MRLFLPFSGLLAVLLVPFLLAGADGWNGQRSFSAELGSTLGISALGVLAIGGRSDRRLRALRLADEPQQRIARGLQRDGQEDVAHEFEAGQAGVSSSQLHHESFIP